MSFLKKWQNWISIHAPSRERLFLLWPVIGQPSNFNPRSLAGATLLVKMPNLPLKLFQSTLPRGSDDVTPFRFALGVNFNPRSLAGATITTMPMPKQILISIHAPSRERQHQNKLLLYSFKSSIFCEPAQLKYSRILF